MFCFQDSDMKCNFKLYQFWGLVSSGSSTQAEGYLGQPGGELGLFIFIGQIKSLS